MPYHITYSTCPFLKRKKHHIAFQKKLLFGRAGELKQNSLPGCTALLPCISCGVPLRRPRIVHCYKIFKNAVLYPLCTLSGLLYRIFIDPQYHRNLGFALPFVATILLDIIILLHGKWEPVMTDDENTPEKKEEVFSRENERASQERKVETRALLFCGLPIMAVIVIFGIIKT